MAASMAIELTVARSFADTLAATRAALKAEGFGVLTEIDLQATFKEKLGHDFRPYVILGACNPPLAYAAVTADPAVGILLPCNVAVESADAHRTVVHLTDPAALLSAAPGGLAKGLEKVAADAHARMLRVADALRALGTAPTMQPVH